jgi:uncharacterized protein YegL
MYIPESERGAGEARRTLICLILDRSGSMNGLEDDVVGGVNTFLAEQKKLPDAALIGFTRFDSLAIERFRDTAELAACAPLVREEFQPRGGTPLLDAVGVTIAQLEDDCRRLHPDRVIVVIITDGQENASREYSKAQVKKMIEERSAGGRWSFLYLGANVDAFAEGGSLGVSDGNIGSYTSSARGTDGMYRSLSGSVRHMRSTGSLDAGLGGEIDEDGKLRRRDDDSPPTA